MSYEAEAEDGVHGYEYISISWAGTSKTGKTNVYTVTNNKSGGSLGVIKWHGPWRQYVFFPDPNTLYSKGCMLDIIDFLDTTTSVHLSIKYNELRTTLEILKRD